MKKIKNSLLAFLLIFAFIAVNLTFTSCDKDEDDVIDDTVPKHKRLNEDQVTWEIISTEMKNINEDRKASMKTIDDKY